MDGRLKLLVFAVAIIGACSPTRWCIESSFSLSADCRLPRWFNTPSGANRLDYEVTMDYWGPLVGSTRTATVTLRDHRGRALDSVIADMFGHEPLIIGPTPTSGRFPYPRYELLTARGITEVIEHRRMEPIFYVNDDTDIRRKLLQKYGSETR